MANITAIIKNLGNTAEKLIEKNLIPVGKFEYLFEGADTFNCEPETGLTLVFNADSRTLESVQIMLINAYEDSGEYVGKMPEPFLRSMDKTTVRGLLGQPDSSGGMKKIPVIGVVGGYDSYTHKISNLYPNTKVRLLYLADLRAHALIFEKA
ncbi:hypothetical protein B7R74_01715 [Yersinia pseudotuberculosis]|uniref:Uncharacterized protein n=1 Tax=Yersinia pseudotuberculosis TaxID=633 RepID=A0A380QDL1_YERPU|nr:DUF6392 family protein [Yersinia pseudotuberculosis]PSH23768.1 hypothetical protein B7R74_01715 [Yersinia pseudotuberculosis]SUP86253.1 Uncharacterised protein [Yersinia pseudotuberculosis]